MHVFVASGQSLPFASSCPLPSPSLPLFEAKVTVFTVFFASDYSATRPTPLPCAAQHAAGSNEGCQPLPPRPPVRSDAFVLLSPYCNAIVSNSERGVYRGQIGCGCGHNPASAQVASRLKGQLRRHTYQCLLFYTAVVCQSVDQRKEPMTSRTYKLWWLAGALPP
jgi:hypothetical protein